MPQRQFFGYRSINSLNRLLNETDSKTVFLVTGRDSYERSGARESIEEILHTEKCNFKRFCGLSSNPQQEEIEAGFELFQKADYDAIIGIGGGSPIDVAKEIKLRFFKRTNKKIPLIAIPTTAGSGSESTYFTVYYLDKEKQSGGNSSITLPDYVIMDPNFTLSLSREVASSTAMDALSQSVESYWSINSTEESKKIAQIAISLLLGNLESALNLSSGEEFRKAKEQVMLAANLSGKAINITKTTACHAISYPLTSYFHITHGHATSLTLGEMLVYNSQVNDEDCTDKRGVRYVQATLKQLTSFFKVETAEKVRERLKSLMSNIGLETRLSQLGILKRDLDFILSKAFNPQRIRNNPRVLTSESLMRILENIF